MDDNEEDEEEGEEEEEEEEKTNTTTSTCRTGSSSSSRIAVILATTIDPQRTTCTCTTQFEAGCFDRISIYLPYLSISIKTTPGMCHRLEHAPTHPQFEFRSSSDGTPAMFQINTVFEILPLFLYI